MKDELPKADEQDHLRQEIKKISIENPVKTYSLSEVREKHKAAYEPWTTESDLKLTQLYCEEMKVKDIALQFGRTKGAIRSRIKKLELAGKYD